LQFAISTIDFRLAGYMIVNEVSYVIVINLLSLRRAME